MGDAYILIYRYWVIFYSSKGKKYYKGGEACTPVTENGAEAAANGFYMSLATGE